MRLSLLTSPLLPAVVLCAPARPDAAAPVAVRAVGEPVSYTGVPTRTLYSTYTVSRTMTAGWPIIGSYVFIDHATRTVFQPGPFTAGPPPATVTQRVILRIRYESVIVREPDPVYTDWGSFSGTGDELYAVHPATAAPAAAAGGLPTPRYLAAPPSATDWPPGAGQNALPCKEARSAGVAAPPPDPGCERRGLKTACQGRQCDVVDGAFWCLVRANDARISLPPMGRACWGAPLKYMQALTPCLEGDYLLGCNPGEGYENNYAPYSWVGIGSDEKPSDG